MKGEGVGDLRLLARDKLLACPLNAKLLSSKRALRTHSLPHGLVIQNLSTLIGQRALETEREVSYHEQLHLKRISCVTSCKHGKTIVTGSEDCSLRVWHLLSVQQQRKLNLSATLSAHTSPISCVEICSELNVIVSGSEDGMVCVWDSSSLSLQYILPHHSGPVISVAINSICAYILTLTADQLRVYTINAELLSYENFNVNSSSSGSADGFSEDTAIAHPADSNHASDSLVSGEVVSAGSTMISVPCGDWQDGVIAVTGHRDGSIYLWKLSADLCAAAYPMPAYLINTGAVGASTSVRIRRLRIACSPAKTHRSEITCLKLCNPNQSSPNSANRSKEAICRTFGESRNLDLLVGDKEGYVSRWTTLKLDQLTQQDLNSLLATANSTNGAK